MLYEKIHNVAAHMGTLLGRVDTDSADIIRMSRRQLESLADAVKEMESTLVVPPPTDGTEPNQHLSTH